MEFRKFKQRYYDNESSKWKTLRAYYVHFNTGEASNVISLQLPEVVYEKTWTLIPTFTYRHDLSILPGPSFTLKFKWLKWDILTIKWQRGYRDVLDEPEEEETDVPETYLDQETWNKKENR